jgi:hypothetical protein
VEKFKPVTWSPMPDRASGFHSTWENDDIRVSHTVLDFLDGTREAVMTVHKLQDGKIVEIETDAPPVSG